MGTCSYVLTGTDKGMQETFGCASRHPTAASLRPRSPSTSLSAATLVLWRCLPAPPHPSPSFASTSSGHSTPGPSIPFPSASASHRFITVCGPRVASKKLCAAPDGPGLPPSSRLLRVPDLAICSRSTCHGAGRAQSRNRSRSVTAGVTAPGPPPPSAVGPLLAVLMPPSLRPIGMS